jgi:hypothetical protein
MQTGSNKVNKEHDMKKKGKEERRNRRDSNEQRKVPKEERHTGLQEEMKFAPT